jgi:peptide deformylase
MIKTVITDLEKLGEIRAEELDVLKDNQLVRETTLNLKHTIQANNYTHLSGPQIGVDRRIMCINFNGDIRTMINPVTSCVKGFVLSRESDASIPGKEFILPRNGEISIVYQTPTGKIQSNTFKGKAAFVVQAAMQTLDGLYISDVGLPLLDGWDDLSEEDKDSIISDYLESLDIKKKDLDKEIESNETLKQISDAAKFMQAVASGEVEIEK